MNETEQEYRFTSDDEEATNSIFQAISHLIEATNSLDNASVFNAYVDRDDAIKNIISIFDTRVNKLKKLVDVPENNIFEHKLVTAKPAEKTATPTMQLNDNLGLHSAVNVLYVAIEQNDLKTALECVEYIETIARDYADPRSEAHDHLHFFNQVQALYSAIDAEDKPKTNDIINKISSIVDDGIKSAKFDNEFNKEWDASHNQ